MTVKIDGRPFEFEPGQTVLDVARTHDIEIPTLCHRDGLEPNTSCFLCVVEVEDTAALKPSCALPAENGLSVLTDSEKVTAARRTALELLFSDHAGGCIAPCSTACPAHLDVPIFLDHLRAGREREAMAAIKDRLALPAILGYVCRAHCQPACVRGEVDEPVSIRLMHRLVAERDYGSCEPWQPSAVDPSDKRIAIVGAGPAGLSAAWQLTRDGHQVVVFDAATRAGGLLRSDIWDGHLPPSVVDREIQTIEQIGVKFHFGWRLGQDASLDEIRQRFDAVVVAVGAQTNRATDEREVDAEFLEGQGLQVSRRGLEVDRATLATNVPGVFATGDAVLGRTGTVVRAVGSGPALRASIAQYLAGEPVTGEPDAFRFWQRHTDAEKDALRARTAESEADLEKTESRGLERMRREASRCLQCHCEELDTCQLRRYGIEYGINPHRFRGDRRELDCDASHAAIVYEPGKCILCGLCVQVAQEEGEERGLSFAGRGFSTRVVVPLGAEMSEGLRHAAERAARLCPTAALHIVQRETPS